MANALVKFDADRKLRFLMLYRLTGQLQRSARECGISPATVREHLQDDLDFRNAVDEAYSDFKELVEAEVMRRAIMGWDEPVYQQGMLAGSVRKYDSRLLELLAKRHIPEYKEKFEISGNVTAGILATPAQSEWGRIVNAEVVDDQASSRAEADAEAERKPVFRDLGSQLEEAADPEGVDRGEELSGEGSDRADRGSDS